MYSISILIIACAASLIFSAITNKRLHDKNEARKINEVRFNIIAIVALIVILGVNFWPENKEESSPTVPVDISTSKEISNTSSGRDYDYTHAYTDADIDNQFSKYDGSHKKTEEYVKSHMKNPDSYEHVTSQYKIHKDYLEVLLTYRGTNSYGAVVTEKVRAKCNLADGEVLSATEL